MVPRAAGSGSFPRSGRIPRDRPAAHGHGTLGEDVMRERTEVRVFHSCEEENAAEHRRLAKMSPRERCREFAALQERVWGDRWRSTPMVKRAWWRELPW